MAQRTVIEVGPRGGQRVGRYMGKDGKIHWIYLGSGGAGGGSGLEHGHAAPDDAPAEEHRAQPAHETHGHVHKDPRIPPVGTVVTGTYKGQQHKVTVTATGYRYEGNGREYRSLSQLATELADSRQNGFRFFGLHEDAGVDRRRKEPGAEGEAAPKAKRTVALSPAGQQSAQAAERREAAGPPPRTVALAPGAGAGSPPSNEGAKEAQGAAAPASAKPPTGGAGVSAAADSLKRSYHGPGGIADAADYQVSKTSPDGQRVKLSHPNGPDTGWMPQESVSHFKNDLHGKVDVPEAGPDVPHADLINAVRSGKAEHLGKGDDGMAFRVGDHVVKVSTTVPFQPSNEGHRTPQQAAEMLKAQVETANKLADDGIPGIQRSEFVQHGDKGFQIKPYLKVPEKFTRDQLDKIQDTLHAMHDKGYALRDDVQAGLDAKDEPVMFDVGKAAPLSEDDDKRGIYSEKKSDIDNLRRLYHDNDQAFVNRRDPEWKQYADHLRGQLPNMLDRGRHDYAAHLTDEVHDMRRGDARATLKGDELRDALEDIDIDHQGALNKIRAHRDKWEASQAATYGGQNRPLGFGTVPNGHTGFGEHPDFRHGTVSYDKPISPEDARSYQLDRVVDPKQHGWVARQVAEKMAPDAADYLEFGADDPQAFDQAIRQRVGDYLHENGLHADVAEVAKTVKKRLEEHAKRQGDSAAAVNETAPAVNAGAAKPEPPAGSAAPETEPAPQAGAAPPAEPLAPAARPAAAPAGGLPARSGAAPQQGALFNTPGSLTLTSPEAPQVRRAQGAEQPSLFGGAPSSVAPEQPARTNPDEVTGDEQAQRQAAAEESARRRRKPGEPEGEQSAPSSQEPAPKPWSEAPAPAPQAAETQSQTSQAPTVQEPPPAEAPKPAAPAPQAAAPTVQGTARERHQKTVDALATLEQAHWSPDAADYDKAVAAYRHLSENAGSGYQTSAASMINGIEQKLFPGETRDQREERRERAWEAAGVRGENQPRTTGNEEERQGNLIAPKVAEMEAALKPHRERADAAGSPGERLQALTAEYTARSEHGRQLAGMEGPEARAALERNREAMGRLNSAIGSLRAQGAGEKPAPAAAPAESQAEMAESRGRLSTPGAEGKPRTIVTLKGAQQAFESARKRTDLTAAAHRTASEALAKGDFTAAREALAKGSTDRYRKTALEYVDRLEDAATGKSGVERAADRELAGTAPPLAPDRRLPVGEAAALAGLGPAKKPEAAGGAPKTAPPSPQEAAAAAKPGEYHKAIADHAAAHLSAAEEQAQPHVERILEKVGGAAALGESLPSNPEKRARALERWADNVYGKIGHEIVAAGLDPHAAHAIVEHTLQRSNWHPEAKAALLAHITGERGKKLAPAAATIGDGAENLAGGDETRAGHVQQAVDLYDADWKELAQKGEVATARVVDLVNKAKEANTPEARQQAQRALAEALGPVLELARLQDAYPGFQDRAVQPARDALAAASTLGRTTPTRDGAETPLFLQGENGRAQRMKARYRLVEAGDVTTSHDPFSFAQNAKYPEGVQEREYHSDESDRKKVIKQAQGLTPEFMVNTNPDAVNGPPMVLPNGIVLGGNSRAMSLNRAYENHPEVAEAYRRHLTDTAAHFGFTAADVGALKRPMLIRTVEPDDQSNEALARLGHQMNAGFTQAMNPAAEQVSLGKQLRPQTLDLLAQTMSPDESLPDFLDSAGSQGFVDALKKDGVFTERNENQYFGPNKKLNEDGKARVARVLMGRIVGQPDAIRNTPPSLVESVARVVPTLMQADAAGERYSLGKALRTALEGHATLRSWGKQDASPEGKKGTGGALSGKSDEAHWSRAWDHLQGGLEARMGSAHPAATDPAARELVQVLVKRGGPRQIVPVFEEYARLAKEKGSAGQNDMFGGSPEGAGDLLRRAVQNVEARESEQKAEKAATKAEKEQKAREKVIEEHERAKAEAAAAPTEAPAEAAPAPGPVPEAPPPDPQQAAEEARAAREEAERKAAEEQAARDRAEANRNQTSFL